MAEAVVEADETEVEVAGEKEAAVVAGPAEAEVEAAVEAAAAEGAGEGVSETAAEATEAEAAEDSDSAGAASAGAAKEAVGVTARVGEAAEAVAAAAAEEPADSVGSAAVAPSQAARLALEGLAEAAPEVEGPWALAAQEGSPAERKETAAAGSGSGLAEKAASAACARGSRMQHTSDQSVRLGTAEWSQQHASAWHRANAHPGRNPQTMPMLCEELPQLLPVAFTPPQASIVVLPHGRSAYTVADGWHEQTGAVLPLGLTEISNAPSQPFWTVQMLPLQSPDARVDTLVPRVTLIRAWHTAFAKPPRHERPTRSFEPYMVTLLYVAVRMREDWNRWKTAHWLVLTPATETVDAVKGS